jgi:beta-lactamase class A
LTLLVLVVGVAAVSVGPGTLVEMITGLVLARPPAANVPAPAPRSDLDLQSRLNAIADDVHFGSLGAMVVDLQSGASARVNAGRSFPAASLFKLPILVEVLAEEDAGQLDPQRRLTIRQEDWTDGSGVLQARVGDQLTVRELTTLMIQDSDNIAALVLLDVVTVPEVNATSERLGLHATRLVDHRAGGSALDNVEHTTSAGDMAQLLVSMASGRLINQKVSEQALGLLELKQATNWLGADLPFWVKVAHKWGDLPQARNDVGVVFSPRGSYVVAVLTADGQADEAASIIGRTSRMMYDAGGKGPQTAAADQH